MHDGRSSPDEPAGADARPELAQASDAQLEAWAFGRHHVDADPGLADAALLERARRAGGLVAEAEPPPTAAPPRRTRRRSALMLTVAGIVLAAIIATAFAVFAPRTPNSLAVFDRDATPLELELGALVQQSGLSDDAEARVLAESETATVIAVRYDAPPSHSSATVCVAVVEFAVVSGTTCTSADDFAISGLTTTVRGRTGLFAIDWPPQGELQIRLPNDFEVGPSGG